MTTMTRDQVLETVREAQEAGRLADLTYADLRGVDLAGADLTGAMLRDAILCDADLADADLTRAMLRSSDLTGADLRGANLYNTILTNATLTGASLTDTNLRGAWLGYTHLTTKQLLGTRGLRPAGPELPRNTWDELLPTNPEQRQLVEHLLNDGWDGTLREAIETVEGLAGR